MSLSDDRRDQLYREALGWPVPAAPSTAAEKLTDLRDWLRERRRVRELVSPKREAS